MTNVFESDKLKSGTKQIVMEGGNLSVLIAPEVGGRIIDIQGDPVPMVNIAYELLNMADMADEAAKLSFGIHPEISIREVRR